MKTYKSKDVFLNVPGRGDIYVVDLAAGEEPPRRNDVINLDGKLVTVTGVDAHRGQRVGLLVSAANPAWKETQGVAVFEGLVQRPDLFIDSNKIIWVRRGSTEHQAIILFEERLNKANAELVLLKAKLKQAEELQKQTYYK